MTEGGEEDDWVDSWRDGEEEDIHTGSPRSSRGNATVAGGGVASSQNDSTRPDEFKSDRVEWAWPPLTARQLQVARARMRHPDQDL